MILSTLCLSINLFAYDATLAKHFDKTFSRYSLKYLNHSQMFVDADTTMKMIRDKRAFILLDIRTPNETSVVGIKTPNTMEIPFDKLFKKENLDKLPKDKPIVIVCHSGNRALQAATSLTILGFENTKVLYGGIVALSKSDSTKNAPIE